MGSHRPTSISRRALLSGAAGAALATRVQPASAEVIEIQPLPVSDPATYTAYVPAACKSGQFYWYTCEFDAAWAIFKTFGIDVTLEEQLAIIGVDDRIEPYYEETANGTVIWGGDIGSSWSGDYTKNFLARTTGTAFRKVFKTYGLQTGRVKSRRGIKKYLDEGRLIWIKTTVDFKPWLQVTWITPEGEQHPVVLGNDHAVVIMGYNRDVVVIRDVLGPTDTNWARPYEYEVDWATFYACWEANGKDGLAVGPPIG